jgi:hypothetical protein
MSKRLSPAARAYLRKLRNPYAAEQLEDGKERLQTAEAPTPEPRVSTPSQAEKEKSDLWLSQDPYASLWDESPTAPSRQPKAIAKPTCSKAAFRAGCRQIFRPYTPAPERAVLRDEHNAFIERNEDRSSETRWLLLQELKRFDLSNVRGINPQLNREKDAITEEKLKNIERKVLGE